MAVTFTLVASTPNMLRYKCVSTGAQSGDLTAATMLADAIPDSPIYNFIAEPRASQTAARDAALKGTDCNVYFTLGSSASTAKSWGVDASVDATALKFVCSSEAADANGSYLTIRHRHTLTK